MKPHQRGADSDQHPPVAAGDVGQKIRSCVFQGSVRPMSSKIVVTFGTTTIISTAMTMPTMIIMITG